jgi:hypothetical protein
MKRIYDLDWVKTWDYSEVTLNNTSFKSMEIFKEDSVFWEAFTKKHPIFKHLNLTDLGLFGGAIIDFFL